LKWNVSGQKQPGAQATRFTRDRGQHAWYGRNPDTDGGIDAVNDELVEYSGRTLEELQQWGPAILFIQMTSSPHSDLTKAIASGEPYEVEVRLRRFDGAYRWFQDRAVPVGTRAGPFSVGTFCRLT